MSIRESATIRCNIPRKLTQDTVDWFAKMSLLPYVSELFYFDTGTDLEHSNYRVASIRSPQRILGSYLLLFDNSGLTGVEPSLCVKRLFKEFGMAMFDKQRSLGIKVIEVTRDKLVPYTNTLRADKERVFFRILDNDNLCVTGHLPRNKNL